MIYPCKIVHRSFKHQQHIFQSLNGNANAVATSSAGQGFQAQPQAPFGSWYSIVNTGLNYLLGSSPNRFEYPYLIGSSESNTRNRLNSWYSSFSPYDYLNYPLNYYPFNYNYYNFYRG